MEKVEFIPHTSASTATDDVNTLDEEEVNYDLHRQWRSVGIYLGGAIEKNTHKNRGSKNY